MFDDAGNSSLALSLCALDRMVDLNTDADRGERHRRGQHELGRAPSLGRLRDRRAARRDLRRRGGAASSSSRVPATTPIDAGDFVPAAYPEVISVSGFSDFDGKPGGPGWLPVGPRRWAGTECDDTFAFFSDFGAVGRRHGAGRERLLDLGGRRLQDDRRDEHGDAARRRHRRPHGGRGSDRSRPHEALAILRMSGECPNGAWADADGSAGCAGQGTWPDDPDGIAEPLVNARRAAEAVGGTPPPPPPPPPNPTAPAAPVLATATGGVASISLSWTTPADGGSTITGYEIWRGTASGGESLVTTVGVQNGYVDTVVDPGTTYWYQVAAVNAVDAGPRSNELSAALIEPPSAPTLLGAPADGAVALSWTEPADDGGSTVTAYNVYRRVGAGPEGLLATTGAGETTYVDFAVTNGTQYTYRVRAVNAAGPGAFSNAVPVTPTASVTAPDPPRSLTAGNPKGNATGILLKWTATDRGRRQSDRELLRVSQRTRRDHLHPHRADERLDAHVHGHDGRASDDVHVRGHRLQHLLRERHSRTRCRSARNSDYEAGEGHPPSRLTSKWSSAVSRTRPPHESCLPSSGASNVLQRR